MKLDSHQPIRGFPSASAITYHKIKSLVTGDDSRDVMILNGQYSKIDSIRLFENPQQRIDRQTKTDIESSVLAGGFHKKLLLIGSASSDARKKSLLITLRKKMERNIRSIDNTAWMNSIDKKFGPLNIEGAAVVGNRIILGNRRMSVSGPNYFMVSTLQRFLRDEPTGILVKQLVLPDSVNVYAGVSDLCYVKSLDMLFITFTSEDTTDPTKDGTIGDSYVGWISNFRRKSRDATVTLTGLRDLSKLDPVFKSQKVEGISAGPRMGNQMIIHLVSDNDDGASRIFKLKMILH